MVTKCQQQECITPAQMNIIFNTRRFWREVAVWFRIYFRSRYLGIGNAEDVFERLYNLPNNFGEYLRLVFGDRFSDEYTLLLKQHIVILSELVTAHIDGDIDAVIENVNRLYQNGYERSRFLAAHNPFWNATDWRNLIDTYLQYTLEEANSFARDDHPTSIEQYERIIAHAHMIGDYYSQGLFNYIVYSPDLNIPGRTGRVQKNRVNEELCLTRDQMNAIYTFRMFWFELTSWLRAYFIVVFEERGDPANIWARINVIFDEYRAILAPLFGSQVTNDYMLLIENYVKLLTDLITAQKENNTDAINQIMQMINQNIDERITFLTATNPYIDQSAWRNMLTNYTRYTYEEIIYYLSGDHSRSLDAYSRLLALSQELGDAFSYELLLTRSENTP